MDKPRPYSIIFVKRCGASEERRRRGGLEIIARKRTENSQNEVEALNEAQTDETARSGGQTSGGERLEEDAPKTLPCGASSAETGAGPSVSVAAPAPKDDDRADGDSMWKTLMQTNFDEMLESILPELAALADKRRKAEFLDKEMKDLQAFMGEGILIGKEEARREAAARLLDRGLNPQVVAECVDLPEEEVLRIRDERI